jgi:ferredoxin
MKVRIDQDGCVGNGVCADLAGTVFAFDGEFAYVCDGERVLTEPGALVSVPVGLESAVLAAAEECPVGCIYVEGD